MWREDQWDSTSQLLGEDLPYWLRPPKPPKILQPDRPGRKDRLTLELFPEADG